MSVDLETEFSPGAIGRAIDHAYIMKPQSKETIKQSWTPKLASHSLIGRTLCLLSQVNAGRGAGCRVIYPWGMLRV